MKDVTYLRLVHRVTIEDSDVMTIAGPEPVYRPTCVCGYVGHWVSEHALAVERGHEHFVAATTKETATH